MLLASAFHHYTEVTVRATRQECKTKSTQTEKEELILSLVSRDMIVTIENPKGQKNKSLLETATHEGFMSTL